VSNKDGAYTEWRESLHPRQPKGTSRGGEFAPKTTDPATMTASEVNKELDKLAAESSKLTRLMIDTGRGHERFSETATKTDPLALRILAVEKRAQQLRNEITARAGPGWTSMPRGFKKRA
jgi:hypothetical protein